MPFGPLMPTAYDPAVFESIVGVSGVPGHPDRVEADILPSGDLLPHALYDISQGGHGTGWMVQATKGTLGVHSTFP